MTYPMTGMLRDESRLVLACIRDHPGLTIEELTKHLGLNSIVVKESMKELLIAARFYEFTQIGSTKPTGTILHNSYPRKRDAQRSRVSLVNLAQ